MVTRRSVLRASLAVAGATVLRPSTGWAEPFGLPLGVQLYSVREQLAMDFPGTLRELGKLGYREVESVGFYNKSVSSFRQVMADSGLRCVSAHFPYTDLNPRLDDILPFAHAAGVSYIVCSSPGRKTQGRNGSALTLEDWRWNAGEFNRIGAACKKAGIGFAYHNHVAEFHAIDGATPYEELLRLTEPGLVSMEMDCGWVLVGGGDPVTLLRKYPGRFSMMHVKDFRKSEPAGEPAAVELGHGSIDYRPIFAEAAATQTIQHVFVEQEHFDGPYTVSLAEDATYLKGFH